MTKAILTIGNAITDIVCNVDKQFLLDSGLVEGSMCLIEQNQAKKFADLLSPNIILAGGSAGNTAATLGLLGVATSFFGVLGADPTARDRALCKNL